MAGGGREWKAKEEGGGRVGRRGDGADSWAVTGLRLPSDFTNEMGKNCQTVRAGSNGHPVLRSLKPHPCGFPLLFRPFHK